MVFVIGYDETASSLGIDMSDFKEDGYKTRADMAVKTLILGKTDAGSIGRSGITPKIRRLPKMFLSILKPVVTVDFPVYPLKRTVR